jgi:hypothetical protein
MPNPPQELAITLPLEVVERILALAMTSTWVGVEPKDVEAIKLVDREVEAVKKAGGRGGI